jgi:hypothetical protein
MARCAVQPEGSLLLSSSIFLIHTHFTPSSKQQAAKMAMAAAGWGANVLRRANWRWGCFFFWWGLRGVGVAGLRLPLSLYRRISFFGLPIKSYSGLRPLVLVCIKTHTQSSMLKNAQSQK